MEAAIFNSPHGKISGKFFLDTEFNEDFHKPLFGRRRHFIDLISIGIVGEDGRQYYAISKDFDVDAAWNKFQMETDHSKPQGLGDKKVYWLRDNVLMPIFFDLWKKTYMPIPFLDKWYKKNREKAGGASVEIFREYRTGKSDLKEFKRLLGIHGKSNAQIADEISRFILMSKFLSEHPRNASPKELPIEIYAYYADYDWVAFCSLYGSMVDLPKGFPKYCRDLKQMLDEGLTKRMKGGYSVWKDHGKKEVREHSFEECLNRIKSTLEYPVQKEEHNALYDAHWNKDLHYFLTNFF